MEQFGLPYANFIISLLNSHVVCKIRQNHTHFKKYYEKFRYESRIKTPLLKHDSAPF